MQKIIFVVGPPKCGKQTQANRLCAEYGYKHISLSNELAKDEKSKQLTDKELVELLRRKLVSVKADKCLVSGFPCSVAQSTLFEADCGEVQGIVEVAIGEEVLKGRIAQMQEDASVEARIADYYTNVKPVLEYYRILGKVRTIDGGLGLPAVYKQFIAACLPETYFVIGPRCSGKTTVCQYLANRANMKHIDFTAFTKKKGKGKTPEDITKELIMELHRTNAPKVIVEGFPENSKQLLYFLLNAITPAKCILLSTPENSCITFSQRPGLNLEHASSAVLCKQIKDFYLTAKEAIGILKKEKYLLEVTNGEEIPLETLFESVGKEFDPEVVLVRNDDDAGTQRDDAIKELCEKLQYRLLDVAELFKEEIVRKTALSREFIEIIKTAKYISAKDTIKLIRKYIYTLDCHKKFVLKGFPKEIAQLKLLESTCCHIAKEFYFYPEQGGKISKSDLSTIETVMSKTNRLIPLATFEADSLERYYGNHLTYALIVGAPLSGKTTVAKRIERSGYTLLDALVLTEEIKKKLATEENPAESVNVSPDQLLQELKLRITSRTNKREKFVLDGFSLEDATTFTKIVSMIGAPAYFIELSCDIAALKERYKKKNELQELAEDQVAELDKTFASYEAILKELEPIKTQPFVQYIQINSSISEEKTALELRSIFEPSLILLTREAGIDVDTILQNLSIKYSFIYIPLDSIIKAEIQADSEVGRELKRTRKLRNTGDKSVDWEYCSVHYEYKLLIQLVKDTVKKVRVGQKHVLINGLLNTTKLKDEEDRMEIRAIDELLAIDKEIGEAKTIIRLTQDEYEIVDDDRKAEKIVVEEVKKEEKKEEKKEDEGEEPPPAPEEENAQDKPKFKPEEFAWTNTEGKPRNMGQFFTAWKKCSTKNMSFSMTQTFGASIAILLDSFIASIITGPLSQKSTYVQVKCTL